MNIDKEKLVGIIRQGGTSVCLGDTEIIYDEEYDLVQFITKDRVWFELREHLKKGNYSVFYNTEEGYPYGAYLDYNEIKEIMGTFSGLRVLLHGLGVVK